MTIKTLHITNSYHPTSGGIRTFYTALLAAANLHRRFVRLVVPGPENSIEEVGDFGRIYYVAAPRVPVLDSRYRWMLPHTYAWRCDSPLRRILAAERPDLVEVCDKFWLLYLSGVLRRRWIPGVPVPVIVGLTCERLDDNMRTYISEGWATQRACEQYMRSCYVPRFDFHIAASNYIATEVRRLLPERLHDSLHVCPMGVDFDAFSGSHDGRALRHELLRRVGGSENTELLLYAGRLSKEKNVSILPRVLATLTARSRFDYRLVIAGDGPCEPEVREDLEMLAPGRSVFMGHCRREDRLERTIGSLVRIAIDVTPALRSPETNDPVASRNVHRRLTEMSSQGPNLKCLSPPQKGRIEAMKKSTLPVLSLATGLLSLASAMSVFGQTATAPYQLAVFAKAPAGLSAPDSVAALRDHVFVGYGDGHLPDGSDGLSSQIVDYKMDGSAAYTYTVVGHNDGLKIDPSSHLLWALQNEDANANLVIINPENHQQKFYTFAPALHGGGYDDIVFRDCKVYISASNPAHNPNTGPAIVSVRLRGSTVDVEPVLAGDANAIDIPTDSTVQLNLQDPDSMTLDPLGNIVLDSQADQQLIIVSNPGESRQRALRLPLSYLTPSGPMAVETDDTAFVTSSEGFLLFADKGLNTVFRLSKKAFAPGTAFTAADGGPFVGTLDLTTGVVTPIVTGLKGPGGMVFVDTSKHDGDDSRHDGDDWRESERSSCRDRDWDSH
jgi:glycosyltransferase involved in cell wall biosynthesis